MDTRARGEKICLLLLCWLLPSGVVLADCEQWAAKVVSVQGSVEAKPADGTSWQPAKLDDTFCPGDSLQVGENSRAALVLPNETMFLYPVLMFAMGVTISAPPGTVPTRKL